jgi:hypothetical protein
MSRDISRPPHPIGSALLHVGTEVELEIADSFNLWCEEHALANLELPGFLAVRRFVRKADYAGLGESPTYVTVYELEDATALTSNAYAAHDTSMPEAFSGRFAFQRSVYRELGAASGLRTQSTGPAILHVTVDVDPGYTDIFLKWYAEEHVPAVLSAPGMIGARRFQNVELEDGKPLREGQHAYFTLYEMEEPGVISRPEMMEAAARGACPKDLAPHRNAFNHVYEEIFHAAAKR